MIRSILAILLIVSSLGLAACSQPAKPQQTANNPFTPGEVSMKLQRNVTTKAQVLKSFGSPNVVTQSGNGGSVWTYQKNATVSQANSHSSGWTVIFAGARNNTSGFSQSDRSMTIIISFNKKDVVSNFKTLATNF